MRGRRRLGGGRGEAEGAESKRRNRRLMCVLSWLRRCILAERYLVQPRSPSPGPSPFSQYKFHTIRPHFLLPSSLEALTVLNRLADLPIRRWCAY